MAKRLAPRMAGLYPVSVLKLPRRRRSRDTHCTSSKSPEWTHVPSSKTPDPIIEPDPHLRQRGDSLMALASAPTVPTLTGLLTRRTPTNGARDSHFYVRVPLGRSNRRRTVQYPPDGVTATGCSFPLVGRMKPDLRSRKPIEHTATQTFDQVERARGSDLRESGLPRSSEAVVGGAERVPGALSSWHERAYLSGSSDSDTPIPPPFVDGIRTR